MPTPDEFRQQFPILTNSVHLASCSQGALSDRLSGALFEFQHSMRDAGAPWERWMAQVEKARVLFADLISATPDEVAIVPCASAAAFQVASTQQWAQRPKIITTDLEFPSVAHVWLAQEAAGAKVVHVADHDGVVDPEDYLAAIDESCGLVSVPLISYRNGVRLPVKDVVAAARTAGARTFVDAYQGAGVEPIDVHDLGCDYLTSGSLKYLLGIPGIAFLYVRREVRDRIPPANTGWFGRVEPFAFDPRHLDYAAEARRFETGTPAIPAAYGAVAGMQLLSSLDAEAVQAHVGKLGQELHERLSGEGEQIGSSSDPDLRGPQVAVRDPHPERLAAHLGARRIFTSPRGGLLRLSLHYYNTPDDIDAVVRAFRAYRKL